jgi:hypothetical protein
LELETGPVQKQLVRKPEKAMRDLAAAGEEGLEDSGTVRGENAGKDFHVVIEIGIGENLETRTDCAAFGIVGAIDEARDAGLDDGAGAHGAGFYRGVECCAGHAKVAEEASRFANYDDFGVRGWVAVMNCSIAGTGQDLPIMDDECADGDFAGGCCSAGFLEGQLHEGNVSVHV